MISIILIEFFRVRFVAQLSFLVLSTSLSSVWILLRVWIFSVFDPVLWSVVVIKSFVDSRRSTIEMRDDDIKLDTIVSSFRDTENIVLTVEEGKLITVVDFVGTDELDELDPPPPPPPPPLDITTGAATTVQNDTQIVTVEYVELELPSFTR